MGFVTLIPRFHREKIELKKEMLDPLNGYIFIIIDLMNNNDYSGLK
jgi:hypothetical protein